MDNRMPVQHSPNFLHSLVILASVYPWHSEHGHSEWVLGAEYRIVLMVTGVLFLCTFLLVSRVQFTTY